MGATLVARTGSSVVKPESNYGPGRIFSFQPDEFVVGSDSVAVLGHERCRVKATGRIVEAKWVQIFTLRNGKISRYREYSDTAAWDGGYSSGSAISDRQ